MIQCPSDHKLGVLLGVHVAHSNGILQKSWLLVRGRLLVKMPLHTANFQDVTWLDHVVDNMSTKFESCHKCCMKQPPTLDPTMQKSAEFHTSSSSVWCHLGSFTQTVEQTCLCRCLLKQLNRESVSVWYLYCYRNSSSFDSLVAVHVYSVYSQVRVYTYCKYSMELALSWHVFKAPDCDLNA